MKKISLIILMSTAALLYATSLFAQDTYVTEITTVTMRTGPGISHKILAMLKSGTKLEVVKYQKDWSQVRTQKGKTGWVLTRFLTQKVPDALVVQQLQQQNTELKNKLAEQKTELNNKLVQTEEENRNLTIKNATLVQIREKYNRLKKESSDFLKLNAQYKEIVELSEEQKKKIETLEEESKSEIKFWFLIGPGVFIVGLFLGLSTRKKRRSGLL